MKCKHCENSLSFFHWKAGNKFIRSFREIEKLRLGKLVSCPSCNKLFIYTNEPEIKGNVSLDRIASSEIPSLRKWNDSKLNPSRDQIKILQEIGATPPDAYTNGTGMITFPCKCILKNGKEIDYCYLQLQKNPPLKSSQRNKMKVYWLDQIEKILPSEFALPKNVRFASTRAFELRMSFAPTVVIGPDKKKYYLNWTTDFINFKNWKGKDITLPKNYSFNHKKIPEGGLLPSEIEYTFIYGFWNDKLKNLRIDENVLEIKK